jgi:acetyl esterase/lipase
MSIKTQPSFDIDFEDITYLRNNDKSLQLRLYKPRGSGPFPLVVQLHGGAWCKFDRLSDVAINEPLAKTGVIVAALDFRMPPEDSYPASMADINYAIRWLKLHAADFHTNPNRIGIMGSSSGGHQAALTGMRPKDSRYSSISLADNIPQYDASVKCVILCSPVIDPLGRYEYAKGLKSIGAHPESVKLWLTSHDAYWKTEEAMAEGSPARAIERGELVELPPVLYLNGTDDKAHPRPDLDRFVANYRKAGGEVELEIYQGQTEGFMTRNAKSDASEHARNKIASFVKAKLN